MKCPTCKKGYMVITKDKMGEDNIEFKAFKCKHCNEELLDMRQLKDLADKYKKLRKAKEITFKKWGNSIAVRIPKEITKEYNIISGKHGILTKDKMGIRIVPA